MGAMNIILGLQRAHAGMTTAFPLQRLQEIPVTTMRYAGLASIVKLIRESFYRGQLATPRAVTLRKGLKYYGVSL